MTQFLIEEAAFAALEVSEARSQSDRAEAAGRQSRLEDMARRAIGR